MDAFLSSVLACPACKQPLRADGDDWVCTEASCAARYPVINGRPILINEDNSLFSIDDYRRAKGVTTMDLRPNSVIPIKDRLKRAIRSLIPAKSVSITDFSAQDALKYIGERKPCARVLVIGAGDAAYGTAEQHGLKIVYTDVALGPLTSLVADAHDLPISGSSFDAAIAVAVMEHVLDPPRVVQEITRVLKPDGIVYSVAPFMQQVHMGRYDFQRFSERAHRWLWREYSEINSGVANGSGMAAFWALEYFSRQYTLFKVITVPLRILLQPLLWIDRLFGIRKSTFDSASAFYFFGERGRKELGMKELIEGYRGAQS
ncbi:methyltransferase domain-containing protein [Pseudohaliea sp.]|uniref:methyltransferase domain-containing protein n=1 Tax=Pseudohaliea sp. TaxID=2740289 RepID=UPI0032ECF83F